VPRDGQAQVTGDLIARCILQAMTYGELMLTAGELVELVEWKAAHPHAAFALGPGRVIPVGTLVVKVLCAP
jgi:hypothetical protein